MNGVPLNASTFPNNNGAGVVVGAAAVDTSPTLISPNETSLYPDTVPTIAHRREHVSTGCLKPKDTCGQIRAHIICPTNKEHYFKPIMHTCGRPECPVCWPTWAARATERATEVIEGYMDASQARYHPRHITLSPKPGVLGYAEPDSDALKVLLTRANTLIDKLGITAAAVIPHAYRIIEKQKRYVNDNATKEKCNRYVWALKQPNWHEYLYFSPHVHILGFGFMEPAGEFEKETGWVYRNHGPRFNHTDLAKTVYYLLTHAWVLGNNKAVRYWREMSTRHLGCDKAKPERLYRTCPVCGDELARLDADRDYQFAGNAPRSYRVIILRTYYLRKNRTVQTALGAPP